MAKRVRLKWDKERGVGTVVAEGPEQTVVRWSGYGERCHPNKELVDVKEDGTIHLHVDWRELDSLENVDLDALCGAEKLQRWQFEFKRARATCPECLARASRGKLARVISGKEKKKASKGLLALPPDHIIKVLVKANPFKGAKALRFDKIKEYNGKTVQEFITGGGNLEALSNRVKDSMVEVK